MCLKGPLCCCQTAIERRPHLAHTHFGTGAVDSATPQRKQTQSKMLRNRLLAVGLRAGGPHREALQRAAVNYAGARRRHASSTTTEMTGDNVRQKTIDDLGGPSFLATFNWLFVKGYLPKTQQMQVSGARTFPSDACVSERLFAPSPARKHRTK